MLKIKPLADRVLIEPMSKEEKTKSGIYLPETIDKERPEQSKVLAVGENVTEIKKGDRCVFLKYGPSEINFDGSILLVAKQEDILAILL